ncbi:dihydrolipoamide acetyltransferase component of pyruvate dehydrogenase complex [Arthrobacter mangrovi]|uniref:Dihydrolipoamide acetyltransferase component of pyruvate dehydrogenase complex n=2 Tax=Arthrobacter mangrovi TaxID=2966350 RepID=A0ABQ5MW22_9MICC|nr:dihydrolipoamide acetyltransferase component of pyruvate dehydrogenase complex [Arthrobacter mangrovi]
MPSLGADMERGKLIEWLVKPGDYVHRGDLVAVVDTDKTVMDVETFEEGIVAELFTDIGSTVPVGTVMARIVQTPAETSAAAPGQGPPRAVPPPEGTTEAAPRPRSWPPPIRNLAQRLGVDLASVAGTGPAGAVTRADVERAAAAAGAAAGAGGAVPAEQVPAAVPPPAKPVPAVAAQAEPVRGRTVRSSPRARKIARELGIDPAAVHGSGPEGAVTESDVRAAAARAGAAAGPEQAAPPGPEQAAPATPLPPPGPPAEAAEAGGAADRRGSLRRAVGKLMSRSKKDIPHYYLSSTVDLHAALTWMEAANARVPVASRLVPAALLLKATALAALEVPEVNGHYADGRHRPSSAVHLGVAVSLREGGIIAPAIRDADSLALADLMASLRDVVGRARSGRLQRAEMADPTLTVTNLGDLGVDAVFGVIYPPQVAMVGFGRIAEQAWAHEGMLAARRCVTATLSADHRVSDGLRGGRFLARIGELLQKPEEL